MELIDIRHWRKTTWALGAWVGLMITWLVVSVLTRTDAGAACAKKFDVTSGSQSQADCVYAAEAIGGFDPLIVVGIAIVGLAVLTLVRFMTRPLWRQGHGASFRRYATPLTLEEKRARRELAGGSDAAREQPTY